MLVQNLVSSLVAKVAIGVGVATVGMTAAGAAGALPDPAQHAVAAVVGATTPFQLPDPTTVVSQVKDDVASSTSTTVAGTKESDDQDEAGGSTSTTVAGTGGTSTTTATHPDNHGGCVSAAAHALEGTGAGKTISSIARSDCGKTDKSGSTTTSSTTPTTIGGSTTSSSTPSTVAGTARPSNSGKGSTNSGGSSKGGGNSGKD
jgi:hypothetical protein